MNILPYALGWMENTIRCLFLFYSITSKSEFNHTWFVMNMSIKESKWPANLCVRGFHSESLILPVGDKSHRGLISSQNNTGKND